MSDPRPRFHTRARNVVHPRRSFPQQRLAGSPDQASDVPHGDLFAFVELAVGDDGEAGGGDDDVFAVVVDDSGEAGLDLGADLGIAVEEPVGEGPIVSPEGLCASGMVRVATCPGRSLTRARLPQSSVPVASGSHHPLNLNSTARATARRPGVMWTGGMQYSHATARVLPSASTWRRPSRWW